LSASEPINRAAETHRPALSEVDILDPEAKAFEQPEFRPIEARHEPAEPVELGQDGPNLIAGEDNGQSLRPLCGRKVTQLFQRTPQHLPVKEENRAQCLFWVEAATLRSTARGVKKAQTSAPPISRG
jgi:hypothetical protein